MRISTLVIFWWLHLLGTDYHGPGNMMRWQRNHHLQKNAWTFFHLTEHLPWQNTLQGFQPLATQWVKRAGTSHLGFSAPRLVTSLTTENHLLEHFWVHDFLTSSSVGLSTTLSCTNFTSCEYTIRLFSFERIVQPDPCIYCYWQHQQADPPQSPAPRSRYACLCLNIIWNVTFYIFALDS